MQRETSEMESLREERQAQGFSFSTSPFTSDSHHGGSPSEGRQEVKVYIP